MIWTRCTNVELYFLVQVGFDRFLNIQECLCIVIDNTICNVIFVLYNRYVEVNMVYNVLTSFTSYF